MRRADPRRRCTAFALAALCALTAVPAAAQRPKWTGWEADPGAPPAALREVGFVQKIGERVPLDLAFRDAAGRDVRLGDLFAGRPVALTLVYHSCPMLCPMTLEGVARSLRGIAFSVGEEYDVVVVSFDPREGAAESAAARERAVTRYGRTGTEGGWHFLTGDEGAIAALAGAVGFRYAFDAERGEFAHPAGLVVLTAEGTIARYLFGIDYPPKDLRLALVEAGEGRLGGPTDHLLLYCYRYDPAIGRYTAATMNLIRAGGVATLAALFGFIFVMLRRERRARRETSAPEARPATSRTA
jgi:protein SCO1/2